MGTFATNERRSNEQVEFTFSPPKNSDARWALHFEGSTGGPSSFESLVSNQFT
jgi:hypothetical protein